MVHRRPHTAGRAPVLRRRQGAGVAARRAAVHALGLGRDGGGLGGERVGSVGVGVLEKGRLAKGVH